MVPTGKSSPSWEHRCGRAFGGPVPAVPTITLEARARHGHRIETSARNTRAVGCRQGLAQVPPPQRQFSNQYRYMLVNLSANSAGGLPPPSRTDSLSYARLAGRPPGQCMGSMPSPALPPGRPDMEGASQPLPQRPAAKGLKMFAEMGIQGVKLEEKECMIM